MSERIQCGDPATSPGCGLQLPETPPKDCCPNVAHHRAHAAFLRAELATRKCLHSDAYARAERLEAVLRQIRAWDMLNPVPQIGFQIGDGPWLVRLLDDALARLGGGA
jgi:hypothetical protein